MTILDPAQRPVLGLPVGAGSANFAPLQLLGPRSLRRQCGDQASGAEWNQEACRRRAGLIGIRITTKGLGDR